jgi:asparaginyl-tRNA synthetase
VVARKEVDEATWERFSDLGQETTVRVVGRVRADHRAPGGHELTVTGWTWSSPPWTSTRSSPRSTASSSSWTTATSGSAPPSSGPGSGSATRWRWPSTSSSTTATSSAIDTPILSGAIGESAGTLFETDYFGENAYLAQTGQLYVEAAAAAFRKVYCFGPTFRAEKSKTRRHLTEFWMVEPEVAFADSDANMRLQEEFVSYLVQRAVENCADELATWSGTRRRWRT